MHCKRPATITEALLVESAPRSGAPAQQPLLRRARAASSAAAPGYRGRTAICELLDLTDDIRELILARRPTSEIKKAAREEGMRFLRESAVEQVLKGVTTLREINKVTFVE